LGLVIALRRTRGRRARERMRRERRMRERMRRERPIRERMRRERPIRERRTKRGWRGAWFERNWRKGEWRPWLQS